MRNRWIGLDVGGTKCSVVLADLDHGIQILDKIRFLTREEPDFDHAYHRICDCIDRILARNAVNPAQVQAIGISCGGPLDAQRERILNPPNLPGWRDVPLPGMLREKYGVPAFIENDANACALVEWKMGAGRGTQNMVFLTMGTGMGAGIIAEDRLLRGGDGMGGEAGHLRLREEGPIGFGKAGSFEGYASGGGIHRQAVALTRDRIASGQLPSWTRDGCSEDALDARVIADYARKGDPDARAIYEETGRMLGRGIALLTDMLNPERVVVGSIFGRCEDLLRPSMEAELEKETLPESLQNLRVVPAGTGEALGDLASVMVAAHAMNIDPMEAGPERDESVLRHYRELFERYPALEPCRESIMDAYVMLKNCYQRGNKVMLVGNGGSCADCEHIVGELMKGFRRERPLPERDRVRIRSAVGDLLPETAELLQQSLPAISLTGHAALSTAVQNDRSPLLAAAQQVVGYGRHGDVVWGISTSGNARNVILALSVAQSMGMFTLGLAGAGGGRLKSLCDCTISVPALGTAEAQEMHLPVYHTLCSMLEAKFFDE